MCNLKSNNNFWRCLSLTYEGNINSSLEVNIQYTSTVITRNCLRNRDNKRIINFQSFDWNVIIAPCYATRHM